MKTTILLSVFALLSVSVLHAQIDKGRVQIGGSISAYHQKYESNFGNPVSNVTNVSVSPSIGRFYNPDKLAGLFLNFGYNENSSGLPSIFRTYGGGLFFRQYQPVIKKLYIYFDERAEYDYFSGDGNVYSTHGYSIGASLLTGMAYDIAKKMQLELSLNGLAYANYSHANNSKGFVIGTSLEKNAFSNIGFGFRYYLN